MATVHANGRSIVHKGDGQTNIAAPPDVCKTPSPGGPIPIPYVNIANNSDLASGTKKVKIEGNSVGLENSNLSTSSGDEPGTAGGLISSKNKGKMTWGSCSLDVKFEGKGVVRFMDVVQHNGNSFNTAFIEKGGTGVAYGDDFEGKCPICDKGPKEHRIIETPSTADLCTRLIKELRAQFDAAAPAQKKDFAKKKGGGNWGGYMVGVMVCKCNPPKSFAAMSGESLPGFDNVVGKISPLQLVGGGAATMDDFAKANTSGAADLAKKMSEIDKAAQRIILLRKGTDMEAKKGYNYPGSCAGAKLVSKSGHAPLHMTEMFFLPPWKAEYRWRRTERKAEQLAGYSQSWRNKILQNKAAKEAPETFTTDQSVASCHTCQEILYMTMCPERACP